jgi:serine/threonine protein kinase
VNALAPGTALLEYRIDGLLGVGGFGLTYLATDTNLNLKVAVKEYLPSDVAVRDPDHSVHPSSAEGVDTFRWGKQRFLDESRTLASFRHPNIVRVMRFFEAFGTAYMVMEFVAGSPLPEWVKTRRPLPQARIAALAAPILDGLDMVHGAGYLHRDIKPDNVYMREDDTPVLLDFGSARQTAISELTAVLSPGWAPFEQYHTLGKQGPWSDLYALGGVLYWLCTGNKPLEAAARMRADPLPPAVATADRSVYSAEFLAAIDWALAPNEQDRPQSVAEFEGALLGTGQPAPRPAPPKATGLVFEGEALKRLEAELAKHIGPIAPVVIKRAAQKSHSFAALVQSIAAEIENEAERAAFIRRCGRGEISQPSGGTAVATKKSATQLEPKVLELAEKRLAQYIGAVARVVVKRAAAKARDESELYFLLGDEIEDREERKAFIRSAISTTRKTGGKP